MSDDPIDQLGARLFKAARDEPLPDGASQRALEAARRERSSSSRPKLLLWAAAAALVVGAILLLGRERPMSSIDPEPLGAVTPVPRPPAPASSVVPGIASSGDKLVPRAVPTPARPARVSLSDELEILKGAERALAQGDTQGALKALDRYDGALKGKQLGAEATLLRIETLSRAGRNAEATELARRFIAEHPTSPLVDRARSFIQVDKEQQGHD
jgi:hypothetical protein